jgi:hypothetical protein
VRFTTSSPTMAQTGSQQQKRGATMRNDEIDLRAAVVEDIAGEYDNVPLWIIARTLTALETVLASNGLAIVDENLEIVEL